MSWKLPSSSARLKKATDSGDIIHINSDIRHIISVEISSQSKINISGFHFLPHNAPTVVVDNPNFLQYCVKRHHLPFNKRPRVGWASVSRRRDHASATAGEDRGEQPGRAADTTAKPNDNGLIDGRYKRLAQRTPHTCAHLKHAHTHTHRTLASYQPRHQAPASLSRLLRWDGAPALYTRCQALQEKAENTDEEKCGEQTKGKRGSLYEHRFTCVVGSFEYAFRHFWSPSLAHSEFLSPASPFPRAVSWSSASYSHILLRSKWNMLTWAELFHTTDAQDTIIDVCTGKEWWLNVSLHES